MPYNVSLHYYIHRLHFVWLLARFCHSGVGLCKTGEAESPLDDAHEWPVPGAERPVLCDTRWWVCGALAPQHTGSSLLKDLISRNM